ncbi:MAG: acylneuraminate cytidylyltransferase family protein [bacterium]|nr:acylneuraminate cytidylyltransferase family protein [bacterium]MDZ4284648.1 acylneuraminate cytidylyltransferase family protein [Patescibacteria group bacterium]
MKKDAKILVFIPARGGSKRVQGKNTRPFAGKPLISYTIRMAKTLRGADFRIIVSTEDEKIAQVARRFGAEVPFLRPQSLAQDDSLVADSALHLLARLRQDEGYVPDYIMHLQPPSPLAEAEDVYRCIEALRRDQKADAALTVCSTHPLLYRLGEGSYLELANKKIAVDKRFMRRGRITGFQGQKFHPAYKLNGCFVYLVKYAAFVREKTFQPKRTLAVVVDAWRSIDIDTPDDFVLAETIYRNRQKIRRALASFI